MKKLALLAALFLTASAVARAGGLFLHEGFDDLASSGWTIVNASVPPGASSWFQGNAAIFPAAEGAPGSYAAADFNSTDPAGGTISVWLISPEIDFAAQGLLFVTRALDAGADDALNVMISDRGGSLDLADFGLLLAINAGNATGGMPTDWTVFFATLPRTGSGRFAFQYTVGPGSHASYIGVDSVSVAPPACVGAGVTCMPEPATLPLMAIALAVVAGPLAWRGGRRRWRRSL